MTSPPHFSPHGTSVLWCQSVLAAPGTLVLERRQQVRGPRQSVGSQRRYLIKIQQYVAGMVALQNRWIWYTLFSLYM